MLPVPDHVNEAQQRHVSEPNTPTAAPGTVVDAATFVADQQPRLVIGCPVPLPSSPDLALRHVPRMEVLRCMRRCLSNFQL